MNLLTCSKIFQISRFFFEIDFRSEIPKVKLKPFSDPEPKPHRTFKLTPLEICFLKGSMAVSSFEGGGDNSSTFWESHFLFQIQR